MRKNLLMLVLVGVALILTACGSNEKKTATINVEMLDVKFRPNEFTLPAGAEVTFTAKNYDLVPHNFIIFKKGFDAGEKYDHEDDVNVYWRLDVPSLQTHTLTETFTAPTEPGEYFVACSVHSHLEDGMVGKLIVK